MEVAAHIVSVSFMLSANYLNISFWLYIILRLFYLELQFGLLHSPSRYVMLFSWLFQPLIKHVKRIHLKTTLPGLRVEG